VAERSIGEGPGESCVRKKVANPRMDSNDGEYALEGVNEGEEVAEAVDAPWGGHVFNRCFTLARRSRENSGGVTISRKSLNDSIESLSVVMDDSLKEVGPEEVIDVGSTVEETNGGDLIACKSGLPSSSISRQSTASDSLPLPKHKVTIDSELICLMFTDYRELVLTIPS
jgi:hypothetical protein